MHSDGFEQWFKLNKGWTTPSNEWTKVTTDLCRRTTEQQLEMMSETISRVSQQLKRLSNAKKPEDFMNVQRDIINEDMTASIEAVQQIIHTSLENMEEVTKLCGTACHTTSTPNKMTTEKSER